VIVIGAVLLDMYRTRKAAEIRIKTPADAYRESMLDKIASLRQELTSSKAAGDGHQAAAIKQQIGAARMELKTTFARMKAEEKAEQARIRAEEKEADREFAEMLKSQEDLQEEKTEP
jgi:ribose transport system permease protein